MWEFCALARAAKPSAEKLCAREEERLAVRAQPARALRATGADDGDPGLRRLSIALAITITPGVLFAGIALFLSGQRIGWW